LLAAAAAALGVLVVGLAGFAALRAEPSAAPLAEPTEIASAPPVEAPAPATEEAAIAPAPKRVVEVSSEPPGAVVIDMITNQQLGKTPAEIVLSGGTRHVQLALPGHRPVSVPLDAKDGKIKVVLSPAKVAPKVAPAKRAPERARKMLRSGGDHVEAPPVADKIAPLRKDEKTQW
jgi:hypothetical protein